MKNHQLSNFTTIKHEISLTLCIRVVSKYFIIVQKLDNVDWTETHFIGHKLFSQVCDNGELFGLKYLINGFFSGRYANNINYPMVISARAKVSP